MQRLKVAACITVCLTLLSACSSNDGGGNNPTAKGALYDRLGGGEAVKLVVDDFVTRVMANPEVNFTRKGTAHEWQPTEANIARLKAGLVAFISDAAGGPVKYTGKDMKSAHAGMKITDKEFFTAATDLEASLIKFGVPQVERAELLQKVAATRGDIVGN